MSNRPQWQAERVLDWINDGCVLFDKRLDCVYANESGSALFGLTPHDIVGQSLHSQFPAPIAAEFQREALTAFSNQTPARTTLHDESAGKWHELSLHPSYDGLLAIITDITSRKRAEQARAAHAEYLQQLVDQIPAFLWVIERDLIVRRIEGGIVRQHSGAIEIASAAGQGTTITLRLPMAPPGTEPVVEETPSVGSDQGGRVLIVQDEAHVREVTARLLQRAGYDVSTAANAETALGMLASSGPFDLVLTDSAMPGMRGEDLAADIGRVQPGLPVILMSGYTDLERSPSASAVVGFLQKPFAIPVLLAEVRRAITRDRPSE